MCIARRISSVILCASIVTSGNLFAQASIDESLITQTITIDPNGSGPNNFTSFASAASFLGQTENKSDNFKVVVAAGTYREGSIAMTGRTGVTVIEGSANGDTILSGADIWTGWTSDGAGNYSKPWAEDWGLTVFNDDEQYDIQDDLGRRSEIVLVDGERLLQVDAKTNLVDDSFAVDEVNDLLWIRLSGGADPDAAGTTVEVSIRHQALFFYDTHNLVLRNLIIENYANRVQVDGGYVVALFGESEAARAENLLVENCIFRGNNSSGMTLNHFQFFTFRDTSFIDNGGAGTGMSRFNHAVIEGCEFKDNNWRIGGYGGFTGWAPAGVKFVLFGDTIIRDCTFTGNLASGLWIDTGAENVFIRDCIASDNPGGAGIYIEASYGPVYVNGCTVKGNGLGSSYGIGYGGILIAESRNVTVTDSVIEDNHQYQIGISTRDRTESQAGYISNTSFDGYVEDVTLLRNRLKGKELINPNEPSWLSTSGRGSALIMMMTNGNVQEYQGQFLTTLIADDNSYYNEDRTEVFSEGGDFGFDRVNLDDWKAIYGFDTNSVWEEVAGENLQVVLEAEDGQLASPLAAIVDSSALSGGYLSVEAGAAQFTTPTQADATYTFEVHEGGSYALIMNVQADTTSDDSIWINVNNSGWINWNGISTSSVWVWDHVRDAGDSFARVIYDLDPGIHTLELAHREDGLNVDQIVFTKDPDFVNVTGKLVDAKQSSPNLSRGVVSGISSDYWTAVNFSNFYESPVVIGTVLSPGQSATPAVVRVRNASKDGCEVKVQSLTNDHTSITRDVHFAVFEEGVYNATEHGVAMEAVKTTSTLTDHNLNLIGESAGYQGAYTSPVIIGQVTSDNDGDWSVFWSSGSDRTVVADSSNMRLGKHVGEDSYRVRRDEELSYVVIEEGSGFINGIPYSTGKTSDSIRGVDQSSNGFSVYFTPVPTADTALLSMAKMDGTDGGFPILTSGGIQSDSQIRIAIDEDVMNDSERMHTTEVVSYLVLGE